jgi:hypothetical protein
MEGTFKNGRFWLFHPRPPPSHATAYEEGGGVRRSASAPLSYAKREKGAGVRALNMQKPY